MTALILPRISDDVAGGIFAGIGRGEYGQEDYALILLPGDVMLLSWDKSMEWAAAAGGDLPSPSEQQLLRANLPEKFQPVGYWSNKQHESDSACAWFQNFGIGTQYGRHKVAALRAVAVSRLPIQSLVNSFCSYPEATQAGMLYLSSKAWAIHNILQTLHVAMPDDAADSEIPVRCLISHVLSLTEPLADALDDIQLKALSEGGEQG